MQGSIDDSRLKIASDGGKNMLIRTPRPESPVNK